MIIPMPLAPLSLLLALSFPLVAQTPFRPPAVPLVTSDPYLSIWSEADRLTDDSTRHWTHREQSLTSLIRIDGQGYRLMGNQPEDLPAMPQTGLEVTPTRTIYRFANAQIKVDLTFMTPALPNDLDVLTRPVTYITWSVAAEDGKPHYVDLYDSASSEIAVNEPTQKVVWERDSKDKLTLLRVGTQAQSLLRPMGDDVRIDWGYAYLAAPEAQSANAIGDAKSLSGEFLRTGWLDGSIDGSQPRPVADGNPTLAVSFKLGKVDSAPVSRHALIGYDEIYSINYFGEKLRPYWRRNGDNAAALFTKAEEDYEKLIPRCEAFDRELLGDARSAGGSEYADIIALAYRECLAAVGIAADKNKQPLLFTKEDTSNGDISTVDVIFPMCPCWLLLSPALAKASLVPVLDYAASPRWKWPNAPHDLGTYPQVFGRDDGGEGMPVEESGNMILMADAIAHADGNADFAARWWPQFTQWAKYLEQYGLDPEDQLCTDDFMGHIAHNANLSIKAILALGAYGDLCRMRGDQAESEKYFEEARSDAKHWIEVADQGPHSSLVFDKPGTWSQKYNLVWDRILGLNVFPPEVAQKEIDFYKTQMEPYGLPLDSRTKLTKTDWSIWSATLSSSRADFESFIGPICGYLSETTARNPIADSYITNDSKSGGMHARPVVGGFFIKMIATPSIWSKWVRRDRTNIGDWAPIPKPEKIEEIVPTAKTARVEWTYTLIKPSDDWIQPNFDDSAWSKGVGGFGTEGTPGAIIGTAWKTDDIWLRRAFVMPNVDPSRVRLLLYHDDDIDLYINGVPAFEETGYLTSYAAYEIDPVALKQLRPGSKITLAVHCHQYAGGQGVDVGLVVVK